MSRASITPLQLVRDWTRLSQKVKDHAEDTKAWRGMFNQIYKGAAKGMNVTYLWTGDKDSKTGKALQHVQRAGFETKLTHTQPSNRKNSKMYLVSWEKPSKGAPLLYNLIREVTETQIALQNISKITKPLKTVWKSILSQASKGYNATTYRAGAAGTPSNECVILAGAQGFLTEHLHTQPNVEKGETYKISWEVNDEGSYGEEDDVTVEEGGSEFSGEEDDAFEDEDME